MFRLRPCAALLATLALTVLAVRAADPSPALESRWRLPDASADDIAAIAALPDDAFLRTSPTTGATPAPQIWLRLKLRGAATADATLGILEIGSRYDDLVELYVPAADGRWQLLRSGEAVGPHGRAWPGLSAAFPVRAPAPGAELVLHARLREHGGTTPRAIFHPDAAAFTAHEQAEIN